MIMSKEITLIFLIVGALILLALFICFLSFIVSASAASKAKKKLLKIAPDSIVLKPKSEQKPSANAKPAGKNAAKKHTAKPAPAKADAGKK